jgi:hypothetical protein
MLFMRARKCCYFMESRTLKMLDMIVLTVLYEYLTLNPGLSIIQSTLVKEKERRSKNTIDMVHQTYLINPLLTGHELT